MIENIQYVLFSLVVFVKTDGYMALAMATLPHRLALCETVKQVHMFRTHHKTWLYLLEFLWLTCFILYCSYFDYNYVLISIIFL